MKKQNEKIIFEKVQLTKINSMANIRGGNDNGGGMLVLTQRTQVNLITV